MYKRNLEHNFDMRSLLCFPLFFFYMVLSSVTKVLIPYPYLRDVIFDCSLTLLILRGFLDTVNMQNLAFISEI